MDIPHTLTQTPAKDNALKAMPSNETITSEGIIRPAARRTLHERPAPDKIRGPCNCLSDHLSLVINVSAET
jgi:hypothetical protein